MNWSAGTDVIIGSTENNFELGFDFGSYIWKLQDDPAAFNGRIHSGLGLLLDNSSGTINVGTEFGTTTVTGANRIEGTVLDDTFIGSASRDKFEVGGGTDTVTGGAGLDTFEDISALGGIHGQEQTKLTITDYESYEEIEFEAWGDHSYGFTKADIESQFSIRYDEATQQTLLSINTDKVNKEDFVVLKDKTNGKFELSHYSLEDGLTGLGVFLKDENATRNDYWVGEDVDQFGIKHFVSGGEIGFDKDFGFDSEDYADEVSVTYDSVKDQTLIDVNTATFTKDAVVVIDGHYDLGQIELRQ